MEQIGFFLKSHLVFIYFEFHEIFLKLYFERVEIEKSENIVGIWIFKCEFIKMLDSLWNRMLLVVKDVTIRVS